MRTHGITATYTDGCRCNECRHAAATYRRTLRARHNEQGGGGSE